MATLAPKLPYTHPFAGGYPYRGSQRLPSDPDALAYLAAVAAADGAPVEVGVATAVDDFFKGCKADGTFSALKAACILCGARTLAGALVPLAGDAPTNNNFVDADYNRETGLIGNGSTKYLDSGRADNDDPPNDSHMCVYVSAAGSNATDAYIGSAYTNPLRLSYIVRETGNGGRLLFTLKSEQGSAFLSGKENQEGFLGENRSDPASFTARADGSDTPFLNESTSAVAANYFVFARNLNGSPQFQTTGSLAFYSIGESISDLSLLDARVSALVTAIGAAL
jgi:hypothetical protein